MKILVLASDKGGKFVPFIEEQSVALQQVGVEIIRYGVTGKGIIGYLRELPALRRFICAERPDLIHAHYGLCGLLANLQRRVPVVTTYHGSDINLPSVRPFSKISMLFSRYNIFVSKRNVSIALSPHSLIASRLKKRSTLLPCGVNLTDDQLTSRTEARKALGIADGAKVILFAGAFDNAVKDPELAFAAIELLQTQCSGADAPVYSVQCEGEEISGAVTSACTPYTIHYTPILQELRGFSREEVNCWMCVANCLLLTSKTEGSPQVIKEAMACGCPIVSVDVGDVAERTSGVEGCYIVHTREPNEIAKALQKALAFEGKSNGREKIIEMGLSNEQVAERLIEIYKSIKE